MHYEEVNYGESDRRSGSNSFRDGYTGTSHAMNGGQWSGGTYFPHRSNGSHKKKCIFFLIVLIGLSASALYFYGNPFQKKPIESVQQTKVSASPIPTVTKIDQEYPEKSNQNPSKQQVQTETSSLQEEKKQSEYQSAYSQPVDSQPALTQEAEEVPSIPVEIKEDIQTNLKPIDDQIDENSEQIKQFDQNPSQSFEQSQTVQNSKTFNTAQESKSETLLIDKLQQKVQENQQEAKINQKMQEKDSVFKQKNQQKIIEKVQSIQVTSQKEDIVKEEVPELIRQAEPTVPIPEDLLDPKQQQITNTEEPEKQVKPIIEQKPQQPIVQPSVETQIKEQTRSILSKFEQKVVELERQVKKEVVIIPEKVEEKAEEVIAKIEGKDQVPQTPKKPQQIYTTQPSLLPLENNVESKTISSEENSASELSEETKQKSDIIKQTPTEQSSESKQEQQEESTEQTNSKTDEKQTTQQPQTQTLEDNILPKKTSQTQIQTTTSQQQSDEKSYETQVKQSKEPIEKESETKMQLNPDPVQVSKSPMIQLEPIIQADEKIEQRNPLQKTPELETPEPPHAEKLPSFEVQSQKEAN